jgi:hypothetical protein
MLALNEEAVCATQYVRHATLPFSYVWRCLDNSSRGHLQSRSTAPTMSRSQPVELLVRAWTHESSLNEGAEVGNGD